MILRFLIAVLLSGLPLLAGSGSDWPGFLGPSGDGKSPETGIRTEFPLPIKWTHPVGEGYSAPSIAAGRLFFFDRHEDMARLSCLDAATGKELWRAEYPTDYEDMYQFSNGPRTSPVVDDDRVYVFGVEGRLRCHRVTDGELLWEVDTTAKFGVVQNFFGVGSNPVVEGPLLVVAVGGSPKGSPGIQSGEVQPNGTAIVAFDKKTGAVKYQIGDELASYSSPKIVTIGERRRGFLFARGGLIGFDPGRGKIDFMFPWRAKKLESVNAATPVIVDDTVFITESYGPGAALLEIGSGEPTVVRADKKGKKGSLLSHWTTPIHHDGVLYGCSGSGSGDAELRALDYRTGEIKWRKPGLGRTTLLHVDGYLVVLGEHGELHLVRATPEKYDLVAETTESLVAGPAWNAPVLSHGMLYIRGKDRLVALELIP